MAACPVFAYAEWIEIIEDEEFTTYMDPARITKTYETLEYADFWLKMVVHTDKTKDGLSVGDHRLVKYSVKCKTNELALKAYYAYKKTKLIDQYVFNVPKYKPVIPDSKGEDFTNIVCGILYGDLAEN